MSNEIEQAQKVAQDGLKGFKKWYMKPEREGLRAWVLIVFYAFCMLSIGYFGVRAFFRGSYFIGSACVLMFGLMLAQMFWGRKMPEKAFELYNRLS